jgi:DNA-binding transcriptional LysR family regulator
MDMSYVKEFTVLAEVRNFLRASELLFISQSSLSKHVKAIENELGVSLFDRSTRHVRLTEAGEVFLDFASQVVELQYRMKSRVRAVGTARRHSLSIGSIPVMEPYGITAAIGAFARQNTDLSVSVIEGDAKALKQALLRGECELAFVRDEDDDGTEFSKLSFATDALAAVLPTKHPLATRGVIRLQELVRENFLLLPAGSLVHELAVAACHEAGFEPNIIFTGERAENIIDLAAEGMGVGLLMQKAAVRLVGLATKVAVVRLEPSVLTHIKIYYCAGQQLSETSRHFIDSLIVNHAVDR